MTDTQIFHDSPVDRAFRAKRFSGRLAVYALLALWAVICLFPIYWTLTTSFKMAPNVMKGNMIPFVDYQPAWLGWRPVPNTTRSPVRSSLLSMGAPQVLSWATVRGGGVPTWLRYT